MLRVLDYIATTSFGYILYYGCFNMFCNVWVFVCVCVCVCRCGWVGFVMCVSFGNMCTCIYCVLYCLYCVFCIVSFMCMFSYLLCLYCHRVTTQLQLVIIIIIINSISRLFTKHTGS
jgi:hypothetical protein